MTCHHCVLTGQPECDDANSETWPGYVNLGPPNAMCRHCGVIMWHNCLFFNHFIVIHIAWLLIFYIKFCMSKIIGGCGIDLFKTPVSSCSIAKKIEVVRLANIFHAMTARSIFF